MSKIKKVWAREILSSGGTPTIEAEVELAGGTKGRASVAFGASAGSGEAVTLLDKDYRRYDGKGMLMAVDNIGKVIGAEIEGLEVTLQREIDQKMVELDGTVNKSRLGGNSILAVSLAVARAGAAENCLPLYRYLRKIYEMTSSDWKLPDPMVVMIEGGKHADKTTDLQEYLIAGKRIMNTKETVRMMMEIYSQLRSILNKDGLSTNVGNEGAFAPSGIADNEKPLEYLMEAIIKAGYEPGKQAGVAIDAAANEFYDVRDGKYDLKIEKKRLGTDEIIDYYLAWIEKYPFVSWEDMLSENDWGGWEKMVKNVGGKFRVIGDDLLVTNKKLLQKAIDRKAASGILIKLNQAGSLTETVDTCILAKENGWWMVPSHRGGGETNDTFMVDLAVAVGAEYIKCGPTRGERVEKYNRLMEIESELG